MDVSDPVRSSLYVFLALSHRKDLLFISVCRGTKMKIKIDVN